MKYIIRKYPTKEKYCQDLDNCISPKFIELTLGDLKFDKLSIIVPGNRLKLAFYPKKPLCEIFDVVIDLQSSEITVSVYSPM